MADGRRKMSNFYIYFMAEGCKPCHDELEEIDKHNKVAKLDLEKDRFMIINMMDEGHRVWTELFKPAESPTMYCVESVSLKILSKHSGADCVDNVFTEMGVDVPWK